MKLSSFENPVSGRKHNIFDIGNLWSMFLGFFVFIVLLVAGLKVAEKAFPPKQGDTTIPLSRIIL
jgi:hypothetical protein